MNESIVRLVCDDICADFWDTAGQERFKSMHPSYYHQAHACILVRSIVINMLLHNEDRACTVYVCGSLVSCSNSCWQISISAITLMPHTSKITGKCPNAKYLALPAHFEYPATNGDIMYSLLPLTHAFHGNFSSVCRYLMSRGKLRTRTCQIGLRNSDSTGQKYLACVPPIK